LWRNAWEHNAVLGSFPDRSRFAEGKPPEVRVGGVLHGAAGEEVNGTVEEVLQFVCERHKGQSEVFAGLQCDESIFMTSNSSSTVNTLC